MGDVFEGSNYYETRWKTNKQKAQLGAEVAQSWLVCEPLLSICKEGYIILSLQQDFFFFFEIN